MTDGEFILRAARTLLAYADAGSASAIGRCAAGCHCTACRRGAPHRCALSSLLALGVEIATLLTADRPFPRSVEVSVGARGGEG